MKKTKKLLALLLALCMVMSLFCSSVFANDVDEDDEPELCETCNMPLDECECEPGEPEDKPELCETCNMPLDECECEPGEPEDEPELCKHEWEGEAVEGGMQYTCALCGESHFLPDDDDAFSTEVLEEGEGSEAEETRTVYCGNVEHEHSNACYFLMVKVTDGEYEINGTGEFDGNFIYNYEVSTWNSHSLGYMAIEKLTLGEGITAIAEETFVDSWVSRSMKEIVLPTTLTTIGARAFRDGCLQKINLDYVTSIGTEAFYTNGNANYAATYGNGITELTVPTGLTEIGEKAFYQMHGLKTLIIKEGVTTIGANAFEGCRALETVVLPQSLETIGKEAFSGCNKLTTISMTGEEATEGTAHIANVTTIGVGALNGANMTKLVLEGIGTIGNGKNSITLSCPKLTRLTLNDVTTVEDYAFYWSPALKTVTMKDVGSVGMGAFRNDTALDEVTLTNVKKIADQAFYGYGNTWSTLRKVTIDGTDTIGTQAFAYNYYLQELSLDNIGTIGQQAFYYDATLPAVTMGKVNVINQYAFLSCTALTSINSLKDVGRIDGFAFYGCANLKGLTVEDATKMGFNGNYGDVMARVEAILKGEFKLDAAPGIVELTPDDGWDDSKVGKSNNWNTYYNGTQLVEQARWTNNAKTEAEVKVDAYYTANKQMDYIFVADLSASMAQLGNEDDKNSRFYDMQSKLLDMTSQLLGSEGYDCQVAIVTFGGALNETTLGTSKTLGFTKDADTVMAHINGLEPLYENTDYALGLNEALTLAKANKGHATVVVFLSDGQPTRDGTTAVNAANMSTYNARMAGIAEDIKAVDGMKGIYGVLHSPGNVHDDALVSMNAVCDKVYESTDTESFGKAMNEAFTAVYGTHTVTIPVGAGFGNVSGLTVSASGGEASYDEETHTITWTITGMPFTKHTLTYKVSLTDTAISTVAGTYTHAVNSGEARIEDGASVVSPKLSRTVTAPPPGGGGGGGGGGGTPTDEVEIDEGDVPLAGGADLNRVDHFAYVYGYADDTVRPTNNITREEVAAIFYRLLTDTSRAMFYSESNDFPDVDDSRWSNAEISTLVNAGILNGYEDGTFRPARYITRAEFAAIAARFEDVTDGYESPFTDTAGHWAENLIAYSVSRGWISGYEDNTFRPNQAITRAEAMTLINNVLIRHVDEEGLLENAKQWPDNTADSWYYFAVLEATNTHTYERRAEDGIMENWLELNIITSAENDENSET